MAQIEARKKYLTSAVRYLSRFSAPAAAVIRMDGRSLDQRLSKFPSKDTVSTVCHACGSTDTHIRTQRQPKNRTHQRKTAAVPEKKAKKQIHTVVVACSACHRTTQHQFAGISRSEMVPRVIDTHTYEPKSVVAATIHNVAVNSASSTAKKRAKARKEGLQALLDKSKQDQQHTSGLNLFDFMRAV